MEPRTRTILLLLLGAALALGGGCLYLAIKAYNTFMEKPSQAEKPHLYLKPEPLELQPCEAEPATTLSYFGFSTGVPWSEVEDTSESDFFTHVYFTSGHTIGFSQLPEENQPASAWRQQDPQARKAMEEFFGPGALDSHYGFFKAIISTTPDELDSAGSFQKTIGVRMRLLMKEGFARGGETGIYSFETEDIRGFQLGDPTRSDSINLTVFDRSDRQLNLWLSSVDPSEVRLTQSEVSCIIQHTRPAEEPKE